MFRTVPLSIIRSFSLYTQQWYMWACEQDQGGSPSWSCSRAVNKPVWHTPLLCVQWKTPDDGQRNCPKRVEFYSKNKFEQLVRPVGFITWNVIKTTKQVPAIQYREVPKCTLNSSYMICPLCFLHYNKRHTILYLPNSQSVLKKNPLT